MAMTDCQKIEGCVWKSPEEATQSGKCIPSDYNWITCLKRCGLVNDTCDEIKDCNLKKCTPKAERIIETFFDEDCPGMDEWHLMEEVRTIHCASWDGECPGDLTKHIGNICKQLDDFEEAQVGGVRTCGDNEEKIIYDCCHNASPSEAPTQAPTASPMEPSTAPCKTTCGDCTGQCWTGLALASNYDAQGCCAACCTECC